MKKKYLSVVFLLLIPFLLNAQEWRNIDILGINKLPARVNSVPYKTYKEAISANSNIAKSSSSK